MSFHLSSSFHFWRELTEKKKEMALNHKDMRGIFIRAKLGTLKVSQQGDNSILVPAPVDLLSINPSRRALL